MAVTISHRNQNITGPHAVGGPSPVISGMVRIDGQGCLGEYQEGLSPLCKKILGFIANLRQARYKSNAKTTSPPVTTAKAGIHGPAQGCLEEKEKDVIPSRKGKGGSGRTAYRNGLTAIAAPTTSPTRLYRPMSIPPAAREKVMMLRP